MQVKCRKFDVEAGKLDDVGLVARGATGAVDRALDGLISRLINDGEITGRSGQGVLVHTPTPPFNGFAPERVLVAGLGRQDGFDYNAIRSLSATVARKLRSSGVRSAATIVRSSVSADASAFEEIAARRSKSSSSITQ